MHLALANMLLHTFNPTSVSPYIGITQTSW